MLRKLRSGAPGGHGLPALRHRLKRVARKRVGRLGSGFAAREVCMPVSPALPLHSPRAAVGCVPA